MENNNIFVPHTKNTAGKVLYWLFEISAIALFAIYFILGVYWGAVAGGFMTFLQCFLEAWFYCLALYGFARVLDMLYCKKDHCQAGNEEKAPKAKKENKEEN